MSHAVVDEGTMETAKAAALRFTKKNFHLHFDPDDVAGTAYLAMCKAVQSWNPEGGRSMKSWVAFLVQREFCDEFITEIDEETGGRVGVTGLDPEMEESGRDYNPERVCALYEAISNLSPAAREAARIALRGEVDAESGGRNDAKRAIKKRMDELGWSAKKVRQAFTELRELANSVGC